jgi:putative zinc finger/helix-turn-helix YgiT family protein
MNCLICGSKLKKVKNNLYHYTESGLSRIYLKGIDALECTNSECGDEEITIPNIEKLHEVIAMTIASQKNKLLPEEIKYLRTYLGFSGADFAKKIGVSAETISRWEKGSVNMKESVERFLRVLVLSNIGPFREYDELETFATVARKTPVKREFKAKKETWEPIAA